MILPWAVALRGSEPGGRPLTHPVISFGSVVGEGKEREQIFNLKLFYFIFFIFAG
jgi:hypothetical protein